MKKFINNINDLLEESLQGYFQKLILILSLLIPILILLGVNMILPQGKLL